MPPICARFTDDAAVRAHNEALAGWLLPIVKTLGGETGFGVASDAIQVLGGAGYTREWPVEQGLRDARVLTVFEGTTGAAGTGHHPAPPARTGRGGIPAFCRQPKRMPPASTTPSQLGHLHRHRRCADRRRSGGGRSRLYALPDAGGDCWPPGGSRRA
jgi:hypothetical protein